MNPTTGGFPSNNNNYCKLINEAGSLCSSDSVEEENEIEEQSGRPIQRQIPQSQRGKAKTVLFQNNLNKASFSFTFCIQLSSQTAHNCHVIYRKLLKFSCKGHLWWGAGEVQKKENLRKGKFNLKKFLHAN